MTFDYDWLGILLLHFCNLFFLILLTIIIVLFILFARTILYFR